MTTCPLFMLSSRASRLHTRVLLIDFDMVEDRGGENSEPSTERTGQSEYSQ